MHTRMHTHLVDGQVEDGTGPLDFVEVLLQLRKLQE